MCRPASTCALPLQPHLLAGAQPFVIEWADPHDTPALASPRGCSLERLVAFVPRAEMRAAEALLARMGLRGLGDAAEVRCSEDRFAARPAGMSDPVAAPVALPDGFCGLVAEIRTPRRGLVMLGLPGA